MSKRVLTILAVFVIVNLAIAGWNWPAARLT